ncbi:DUF58 domain-containing protein [archaeon]|jgi:uncharacterized protein (DUF58 family)|nr:DUF58 domain-containing protein [archaeon]MBT4352261.1 DUF58 domain-containing protein [archaeon]MBT4647147.1 DUF58 domain-containing protein [archaeon]MBT6822150.1 DUF58 domain-containing protein [archaeon]MBT7391775.1 DUF58 domain-containing protein [archaeon]
MINTDFLNQLKRFSLIINKRVTSSFSGSKKSTALGRGLIVNDFRQYVPGDDFRTIDWKIYARTDDFYVKRFEEERSLTTHVLIDTSKSMDYGTINRTKFDYAAMLGLGFAYLTSRENEKFQLSTFNDENIDTFRAKRGVSQVMGFLYHLNRVKCKNNVNFQKIMSQYKKSIKSKSMIIIISDFLLDIDEIKNSLYLFKQHELKVIQVLDRSEIDFNLKGNIILEDSETGKKVETYVSEKRREEYRERLYDHMLELEEEVMRAGGKFYMFSTEEPMFDAFYKILNG